MLSQNPDCVSVFLGSDCILRHLSPDASACVELHFSVVNMFVQRKRKKHLEFKGESNSLEDEWKTVVVKGADMTHSYHCMRKT